MNLKLGTIATLAFAAAFSQAQVTLTEITQPNAGNSAFGSTSTLFATSYSVGTGIATVFENKSVVGSNKIGSISGWGYTASATSGNLGVLTIVDKFSGPGAITANSLVNYTITADLLSGGGTTHLMEFFSGGGSTPQMVSITSLPGWDPVSNSLSVSFNVSPAAMSQLNISVNENFQNINPVPEPAAYAALGVGLIGLLVRKKRK